MKISVNENGLYLDILVTDEGDVRLVNFSDRQLQEPEDSQWFRLVEIQESGFNQNDNHGCKHTGTQPGSLLRYNSHIQYKNEYGTKFELKQKFENFEVTSHIQFYDGLKVIRSWTELFNGDKDSHPIEYVSSFALTGLDSDAHEPRNIRNIVHMPHTAWYGEAQWQSYDMHRLGFNKVNDEPDFSMKRVHASNTGTWPCGEYLPMGAFENVDAGRCLTWQIETAGSWNWELSDVHGQLYLQLSGPSYFENGFLLNLNPAESFVSVPVAMAVCADFQGTIQELTRYRRLIRRQSINEEKVETIFNDYMNCLWGDPTTEKEYPLIDAAAASGCKYYCIDCGWYDDGPWWDGVGEWLPSKARFPGGINEPLDYIRSKGMIPGLWLEIEVMGITCPLVGKVPEDWFFQRNGRPIIDRCRYQLDFRNPEVRKFADSVIDRLVNEYYVGYFKIDYNINAGVGTDLDTYSVGEGLLSHTRSYLSWLDDVLRRYPDLIIENCSSGGMRMEYSLLSRLSLQSVTDQTDYVLMASIACNCPTAVTPEQAGIWSYPMSGGDEEETIFNMVNASLMRIFQSGHLTSLSPERLALVEEGIAFNRAIGETIRHGLPFWPTGLADMTADCFCLGIDDGEKIYLAVWNVGPSEVEYKLPLKLGDRCVSSVSQAYPKRYQVPFQWDTYEKVLNVNLAPRTARIFEIISEKEK